MRLPQDSSTKAIRGGPTLGTFALLPRSSIIPQSLLRVDGLHGYGGESGRVKTHIHIFVPVRMYMFSKCYVGFCTPRRTTMDLKKKKTPYGMRSAYSSRPGTPSRLSRPS